MLMPTAGSDGPASPSSAALERSDGGSLSEAAYRRLRIEIVSGVLRPNGRLVESELSERMGISRTPIREALMRLASDGLVDPSKRGWAVHEHTRDELVMIYETRAALEGYAASLCAGRATEEELDEIERALEVEAAELDPGRADANASQNSDFHWAVFRSCRNPRLLELIDRNTQFYFNYRIASLYTPEELRQSLQGHYQLLAALRRRDGEAAERVVREHLFEAVTVLVTKGRW